MDTKNLHCPKCEGTGWIEHREPSAYEGYYKSIKKTCLHCEGTVI
jgi:DnaJ-class molecular chaperone